MGLTRRARSVGVAVAAATSGWLLVAHPGVFLALAGAAFVLYLIAAAAVLGLSRVPNRPAERSRLDDLDLPTTDRTAQ